MGTWLTDFVLVAKPWPSPEEKGQAKLTGDEEQKVGAFVTPTSLTSFPIASGVIIATSKAISGFLTTYTNEEDWATKNMWMVTLGIAAIIGFGISLVQIEASPPKKIGSWVLAITVAVINTIFLAASALGIDFYVTAKHN